MEITQAEYNNYQKIFHTYDADGSGTIDIEELGNIMRCLGVFLSEVQLTELLDEFDVDGSQEIEFNEFLKLMVRHKEAMQWKLLERGSDSKQHVKMALKSDYFHADDQWKWFFDTAILLFTLYYLVVVLLSDVFDDFPHSGFHIFEVILTIFLMCDVATKFNMADPQIFRSSDSKVVVRLNYLKGWFIFDLLSALPFDLFFFWIERMTPYRIFYHFRLLRVFRVPTLFQTSNRGVMTANYVFFHYQLVPLFFLAFWLVCIIHTLSVVWLGLSESKDAPDYSLALYWVMYTVTTVGYGDVPVSTSAQRIFACCLFVLGVALNGVVVAKLSTAFQKADISSERKGKMRETLAVMNHFNIPRSLQEEILAFQHHLLEHNTAAYAKVLDGLPQSMQDHLGLYIRIKFISLVPMFATAHHECRIALAQSLRSVVVAPEEFVVVTGEEGKEMYFLALGFADIIDGDGNYLMTFKKGEFFGETALLTESKRTASVRALTYCELFRLDKGDFVSILERFPLFREGVDKEINSRRLAMSESSPGSPASPSANKQQARMLDAKAGFSKELAEFEKSMELQQQGSATQSDPEKAGNRQLAPQQRHTVYLKRNRASMNADVPPSPRSSVVGSVSGAKNSKVRRQHSFARKSSFRSEETTPEIEKATQRILQELHSLMELNNGPPKPVQSSSGGTGGRQPPTEVERTSRRPPVEENGVDEVIGWKVGSNESPTRRFNIQHARSAESFSMPLHPKDDPSVHNDLVLTTPALQNPPTAPLLLDSATQPPLPPTNHPTTAPPTLPPTPNLATVEDLEDRMRLIETQMGSNLRQVLSMMERRFDQMQLQIDSASISTPHAQHPSEPLVVRPAHPDPLSPPPPRPVEGPWT